MLGQLIRATRDSNFDIQEIRRALRALTGYDYGPEPASTAEARAATSQAWSDHWTALRLQKVYVKLTDAQIAREFKHEDGVRRLAAAMSLKYRRRDIPNELVPLLSDTNLAVRELAHQALLNIADEGVEGLIQSPSTDRVAAWETWVRGLETHRALLKLAPDRAIEALTAPDAASRWAAVQTIADCLAAIRAIEVGCKALGIPQVVPSSSPHLNREQLHVHLLGRLLDPSDFVRQRVRAILTQINGKHDFGPLVGADVAKQQLAKQRWEVWMRYAGGGPLARQPSLAVLLKRLQSTDPIERIVAIDALSMTSPTAPHAIIAKLKDPNSEVAKTAHQALKRLAGRRLNIRSSYSSTARQVDREVSQWTQYFKQRAYQPALNKFRMGKQLFDKGDIETARKYLDEVIREFPGSLGAQQATELRGG